MSIDTSKFGGALSRGMKILGRRPMSELMLSRKLSDEGYSPDDISGALDRLRSLGFLNDIKYAETLIHYYIQKGFGQKRILNELVSRGIDKDSAAEFCSEIEPDADQIYSLLCSRIKSVNPDQKEINRAVQFLMRRGFPSERIFAALDKFKKSLRCNSEDY